MKLIFVSNTAEFVVSHRIDLIKAAIASGFDVGIAVPAGPGAVKLREEGFAVHEISLSRSGLNPVAEIKSLVMLTRYFKAEKPDVVHLLTIKPVIYGSIAATLSSTPRVICAVTGLGHIFSNQAFATRVLRAFVKALYRFAFRHQNLVAIFQNSEDMELFHKERIIGVERTVLIRGSGVDPVQYRLLPLPSSEPTLVLASRMLWSKGIDTFVAAAKLLRERGINARFVLVGGVDRGNPDGVPEEQLREWADNGVVEWWGFRSDMIGVFEEATIVCLPTYYREGVPKVLIEAASCGRPIVTTSSPGCSDIVRHGETGLTIPMKDVGKLAEACEILICNRELCQAYGRAGRERVIELFSLERVISETLALYSGERNDPSGASSF